MNITKKLAAFAASTNNELFDADYKGGEWMVEAVETHETIEQFVESSRGWAARTKESFGEIAGLKFVAWSQVQIEKGQPRHAFSVVDFGDVRYAIDTDMTIFQ